MKKLLLVPIAFFLASCAQSPMVESTAKLKDGELAVPADYKNWPKFLSEVQRPDNKQIREIYINSTGAKAVKGGAFPNGTVSVMELYKAQEGPDGTPVKSADGKMVKGPLLKVFVMGKAAGWGESAPAGLKNGDWIYSGFLADGKTVAPDPIATCRACHLPLGEAKDFVHRYDEYFEKRS
jgi:Cytochrome P460